MKTIYSVSKLLMLLLGIMFLVTSCLRPELDDCPQRGVRIVVRTHTEVVSRAENNSFDIENVTIYVFDDQNNFVTLWQGDAYVYGSVYEAWLDIDPGTYHFVVWTNHGDTYTASHSPGECEGQSLEDLTLGLSASVGGCITEDIPSLHHGMLTDATVYANQNNEFTITLIPNTYTVNFTVKGLPVCGDEYSFSVKDNNSHYTFDNTIVGDKEEFEHLRTTGFTDDELTASMKVLRLASDRDPSFNFTNITAGESLYADGLVTMINKAYANAAARSVDFSRVYEFDIVLEFDANLGVTVTINGWSYDENATEL